MNRTANKSDCFFVLKTEGEGCDGDEQDAPDGHRQEIPFDVEESGAVGHYLSHGGCEISQREKVGEGFEPARHVRRGEKYIAEEEHREDDQVGDHRHGIDGFGDAGDGEAQP